MGEKSLNGGKKGSDGLHGVWRRLRVRIQLLGMWEKMVLILVFGGVLVLMFKTLKVFLKPDPPRQHALKSHSLNGRFENFDLLSFNRCGESMERLSERRDHEEVIRMEEEARKRFEKLENLSEDGVVMNSDPSLIKVLKRALPFNGEKLLHFTVFSIGTSSSALWNWRQWIELLNIGSYVIVIRQEIEGQKTKDELMISLIEGYPGWKTEFEEGWPDYFYLADDLVRGWNLCTWRPESASVRRGDTTSLAKVQFATQALLRGISVFYLDADSILFNHLPAELLEEKGVALSSYSSRRLKPRNICDVDGCFGVFFMYGGEAQASMMTQLVKEIVTDRGCDMDWFCDDQHHFNQMMFLNMGKFLTSVKHVNMEPDIDCYGCKANNTLSCMNFRTLDPFKYISGNSFYTGFMMLDEDFNKLHQPRTLHMTSFFTNTYKNRVMLYRELGLFIDSEDYYTKNKYLQFSELPINASNSDHIVSLKVSIALAKITARCLILPKLPCRMSILETVSDRGGFYVPGEWCEALYLYDMRKLSAGVCIRESTFLSKKYGHHVSISPCKNCDKAPDAAEVIFSSTSTVSFTALKEELAADVKSKITRICVEPSRVHDLWVNIDNSLKNFVDNIMEKESDVYTNFLRKDKRDHSGWTSKIPRGIADRTKSSQTWPSSVPDQCRSML
mmetsp:Transcript_8586/g.12835  ORF Transcript_8586/g.12835 Transcript_8586/m.12835 type:complete len:673 (+) Transcript_8586:33-2051(+)